MYQWKVNANKEVGSHLRFHLYLQFHANQYHCNWRFFQYVTWMQLLFACLGKARNLILSLHASTFLPHSAVKMFYFKLVLRLWGFFPIFYFFYRYINLPVRMQKRDTDLYKGYTENETPRESHRHPALRFQKSCKWCICCLLAFCTGQAPSILTDICLWGNRLGDGTVGLFSNVSMSVKSYRE